MRGAKHFQRIHRGKQRRDSNNLIINYMLNTIPDISGIKFRESGNFLLIAGPCVVESADVVQETAQHLIALSEKYNIPLIFKSSYRKANRSRGDSFTGIGDIKALQILADVRRTYSVPVITDIHNPGEA
jgi:2-dehydro-3-deoxyphosphooctonate aldolase (KDO 8-P synthase)